jgi:hypothetical protein
MLHEAKLPHTLWPEAVRTAVYLLNRTQLRQTIDAANSVTSFELIHDRRPDVSAVRTFKCRAYPLRKPAPAASEKMAPQFQSGHSLSRRDLR